MNKPTILRVMPDGTPIPDEGLLCKVWDSDGGTFGEYFVIAYVPDAKFPFKCIGYMGDIIVVQGAEPIKEPKLVKKPFTIDDYHGESIRVGGVIYNPESSGSRGVKALGRFYPWQELVHSEAQMWNGQEWVNMWHEVEE